MIDLATKRVSIAVRDFYNNEELVDCTMYLFNSEKDDMGLDPWSLVDSVDKFKEGDWYDLWSPNNPYPRQVNGDYVVFISQADAIRAKVPVDKL